MQTLGDWQHLHKILERKAELAVRGEKPSRQKVYEAEADVEVKNWEKRKSDIAFFEILLFMREIRSSSPNDYSYNRRVNALIRLKQTK